MLIRLLALLVYYYSLYFTLSVCSLTFVTSYCYFDKPLAVLQIKYIAYQDASIEGAMCIM